MLNRVILIGRLVRDVEVSYTQSGKAVAKFILAVNRTFKNKSGEREADFVSCVLWGEKAERLADWTKKGYLISIDGSLRTEHYQNNKGQTIYRTEVLVEHFNVLSHPMSKANQEADIENLMETTARQESFFKGQSTAFSDTYSEND